MNDNNKSLIWSICLLIGVALIFYGVRYKKHTRNISETMVNEITKVTEMKTTAPITDTSKELTTEFKTSIQTTSNTITKTQTIPTTSTISTVPKSNPLAISQAEYDLICSIVMNETGYGSYEGCVAVAQCFRNAMLREGADAFTVQKKYGYYYTKTPNEQVKRAVYDVFYNSVTVTDEPIICFYAPAIKYSAWHESQIFVCEYDGNKFFKFRGE